MSRFIELKKTNGDVRFINLESVEEIGVNSIKGHKIVSVIKNPEGPLNHREIINVEIFNDEDLQDILRLVSYANTSR